MSKWNDWAITTKFPPIKPGYGMNCRTDYKIDVVFKVRTGKGYWRGSKYLYVCNNNTIYLLGSDAGATYSVTTSLSPHHGTNVLLIIIIVNNSSCRNYPKSILVKSSHKFILILINYYICSIV